ncbi:hypothetical protein [Polymorphobacter megasporae]|uniref:hypothetical protein n=1 Tax=Glacieibacterium megasporae TaxID=2835787 RepID=UPI001C1E3C13|nr:hypothetical protein [Polymorphobacter megasporae]UAJ10506.1 hypothetical protein KTC28_01705 [Polymorphobacter megasporae]
MAIRPIVKSNIATFEVASFKLGMSAREVERIAHSRHLRTGMLRELQPFSDTLNGDRMDSFDTSVANIVADRLHKVRRMPTRVIKQVILKDDEGDRWDVRFLATERGPVLTSMAYSTSTNGNAPPSYLAVLKERYGPPTRSNSSVSHMTADWCARGDPTCFYSPHLTVVSDDTRVDFLLEGGMLEQKALSARIEAKGADLAAAGARKPVF